MVMPLNLHGALEGGDLSGLCGHVAAQRGGQVPTGMEGGLPEVGRVARTFFFWILKCSKEHSTACPVPHPPLHTPVTCRETLRLTDMALVPHLLNVILKIGIGYNKILFSISYKSLRGLRLSQVEGRFKTMLGAEGGGPPPKLEASLWAAPPHPAQGPLSHVEWALPPASGLTPATR